MAKKKIPLKVQQTAEKYLASLDSSREQLTNKQWEIVTAHVKLQRNRKRTRNVLLCMGIIFAALTVWCFCIINKRIQFYVPEGTVSVIKEGSESAMTIEPEEVESVIKEFVGIGSSIARCFDFTLFFLCFFVITWILERQQNRIFRAFIPKLESTKTVMNNNPLLHI